jgi:B12-binding domain/radical SAM domain protein
VIFLKNAFILYVDRFARYSIYGLAAVLDRLRDLDVFLVEDLGLVERLVDYASSNYSACALGFSLLTTRVADDIFYDNVVRIVKYTGRRGCLTVAGGPHASGDPLGVLLNMGFKVAVAGEGEPAIVDLASYLARDLSLDEARNIVYIDEQGGLRVGRRANPVNLDDYPPFPYWRHLYTPIEITRGCFHGCWFCQVSYFHGFKPRHRSVGNIVEYAKIMVEEGVRDIRFITPDALSYNLSDIRQPVDEDALAQLLEGLHQVASPAGARIYLGSFPSEVRPEHVTEGSARVLKRYVSNKEIIVGAQSGSNRVLERIHRGHSIEDVFNAVDILIKTGFKPSVDFIFGLPSETEEDMLETVRVARVLAERGARIHLHYYLPLPGTPLFPRRPTPIPPRVRAEIVRLIGSGSAYGSFAEQERLSARIVELVEKGVIRPRVTRLLSPVEQVHRSR